MQSSETGLIELISSIEIFITYNLYLGVCNHIASKDV